jgi:hypothetical protein
MIYVYTNYYNTVHFNKDIYGQKSITHLTISGVKLINDEVEACAPRLVSSKMGV